ncbi:uncharacterized protein PV09_01727 [Verruconis gallopava]|uniref:Heterokaryon incompatibility domain-containing protein n=1 Tax=Verruconis gallopava TaxID=253628 RepID=A0A0D2AMR8_9PEZI|nr:uncharacterized protein PV09_01727 [Verruconis gallopava]KIW07805.1 hypothetical protein PV09_01727 [Verruconis gallopava]
MAPKRTQHYPPLDYRAGQVRLITFQKATAGAIRGRLHVFPISQCPEYLAVSYTWGEEPPRRTVYLNNNKIRIRENIYQALKVIVRMRNRHSIQDNGWKSPKMLQGLIQEVAECQYFWIDSLCINQASVQERNHQVGLMRQIFSNARSVIAWLGPESENSSRVMKTINEYQPQAAPVALSFMPLRMPEDVRAALLILQALPYWRRLWIVQEIILARNILLLWGEDGMCWNQLANICLGCGLDIGPQGRMVTAEYAEQNINERSEGWIKLVMRKKKIEAYLKGSSRQKTEGGDIKSPSLYALIMEFSEQECREPRDKVIGLLGLLFDEATELGDYSVPLEEYYEMVCRYAFRTADIKGDWSKQRFQGCLRRSLGLPVS